MAWKRNEIGEHLNDETDFQMTDVITRYAIIVSSFPCLRFQL